MPDTAEPRVAVYIDFDNIVISQYDAVHGRGNFIKEKARNASGKTVDRLTQATVNIGAVLDFASPSARSRSAAPTPTGRRR